MLVVVGRFCSRRPKASRPPAEAPMQTMGRGESPDPGCGRARRLRDGFLEAMKPAPPSGDPPEGAMAAQTNSGGKENLLVCRFSPGTIEKEELYRRSPGGGCASRNSLPTIFP